MIPIPCAVAHGYKRGNAMRFMMKIPYYIEFFRTFAENKTLFPNKHEIKQIGF